VAGKTNLYDLNTAIQSDFESEEFDTVGGFVFGLFGRQPAIGDKVRDGDYEFEVLEADGRRITSLHVVRETATVSMAQ
jgi:Mg2+/Co2+ transporter CorC